MLGYLNRQLSLHYTVANEVFVTAFYGIYDPVRTTLTYSSAGHNPPRLIRCRDGTVQALEEVGGPPLGLLEDLEYEQTNASSSSRATSWRFTPMESPRRWMPAMSSSVHLASMKF